ncbi:MAG TPA: GNAT family N-acetyltransferase [Pseudomonadales bacterium]|nr:GNAT family N-acetyltransferase [Pseudomonadales bacterium]
MRRATRADAEPLAAFNADQIRYQDAPAPFAPLGLWTRDLLEGRHPTFTPDDGRIVEERRTGAIVSSMLLVSQTWAYGGVPIRVGQPELVGTRPEYRGRGLVRAQFEVPARVERAARRAAADHRGGAVVLPPVRVRHLGRALAAIRVGWMFPGAGALMPRLLNASRRQTILPPRYLPP